MPRRPSPPGRGKLRVAEDAAADIADPDVEVLIAIPGIRAALRIVFHAIIGAKTGDRRAFSDDTIGRCAGRSALGHAKIDFRVRDEASKNGGRIDPIGVQTAEIVVQNLHLRGDLRIRNVLGCRAINDVKNDRDRHHDAVADLLLRQKLVRLVFDCILILLELGVLLHQMFMMIVRGANTLGRADDNEATSRQNRKDEFFHRETDLK